MKSKYVWIELLNGHLAIGGHPSMRLIEELGKDSCTTIVTLLRKSEEKFAKEIGEKCENLGINWIWLPLSASALPQGTDLQNVLTALNQVKDKLEQGERIFVHCAAGIHRTGAFTYALLRFLGNSPDIAKEIIKKLRPITEQQAQIKHWQWGEQFSENYTPIITQKMENKCIFCSIIKGDLPASVVYEDEDLLAIMDIRPINPGHVLVMPKSCYQYLHQVPHNLTQKLFNTVARIEKALWETEGIICEGTNILQNNGRSAWQEINHVHFHVIPRFSGDGFKIKFQSKSLEREELEQTAKKISNKLILNT